MNAFSKIRDFWQPGSIFAAMLLLISLTACSVDIQSQLTASVSTEMYGFGPGTQVTVTGKDFEPNTAVPIHLQVVDANQDSDLLLGIVTSDDSGAFTFDFTLPANIPNVPPTSHSADVQVLQVSQPSRWRVTLYFDYGTVYDLDGFVEELGSANLVVETADSSPPQSLTPPIQNL